MKTDDLLAAALAFGAVVGLGMWYRQSRAQAAGPLVTQPLAARLLPAATQAVWSDPSMTVADVEDFEQGFAMRTSGPDWGALDQEDADYGMAMRGIF